MVAEQSSSLLVCDTICSLHVPSSPSFGAGLHLCGSFSSPCTKNKTWTLPMAAFGRLILSLLSQALWVYWMEVPCAKLDSRIQFFPAPCLPLLLRSFDSTTLSSHIFFNGKMWLNRNWIIWMESQVSHLHPCVYLCMCVSSRCFVPGTA